MPARPRIYVANVKKQRGSEETVIAFARGKMMMMMVIACSGVMKSCGSLIERNMEEGSCMCAVGDFSRR